MKRLDKTSMFKWMFVLSMVVSLAAGCGGGGGGGGQPAPEADPNSGNSQTQDSALIMGTVQDTAGSALENVTVTAGGKSTTTNQDGYFSLPDLEASDYLVVNFYKPGYTENTRIAKVQAGASVFIDAHISAVGNSVNFHSYDGVTHAATYTGYGASVRIGPDALIDADGNPFNGYATIALSPFDPTTDEGMKSFPGEFTGVTLAGGEAFLESFGFMDVTIRDDQGALLDIAPGKTAEIRVPMPAEPGHSSVPGTIPLWYFDTSDGRWHEEGYATRNGSVFEGTVTHFTAWNCDKNWPPDYMSWLKGTVRDASTGLPVTGATVSITGANWSAGEDGAAMDGSFFIPVIPNASATLQASKGNVKSEIQHIYSTGVGQVHDLGNIYIGGAPKFQITLTWGDDPCDLDAHMAIPSGASWEHLYFGTVDNSVAGSSLDTDDVSGKGPEIITAVQLNDGVYRYSVHHYMGSGDLTSSKAKVNLVVDGLGLYKLTPPTGATGLNDLWRCWDITVSGGKVVNVTEIDDYVHDADFYDLDTFCP